MSRHNTLSWAPNPSNFCVASPLFYIHIPLPQPTQPHLINSLQLIFIQVTVTMGCFVTIHLVGFHSPCYFLRGRHPVLLLFAWNIETPHKSFDFRSFHFHLFLYFLSFRPVTGKFLCLWLFFPVYPNFPFLIIKQNINNLFNFTNNSPQLRIRRMVFPS